MIYGNYDWGIIPYCCFTDCMGIAWDSQYFRPVDNSYSQVSNYYKTSSNISSSTSNVLSYSNLSGVGWDIDIKLFDGIFQVYDNYGYGKIMIEAINPKKTGTSQIHLLYAHAIGIGSVGLSLGPINVQYSGSASSETRGVYRTFTY